MPLFKRGPHTVPSEAPEVVLVARTDTIAKLVLECARKELSFEELCRKVHALGYRTTSLYEMVRAAEREL
jgi:hypothetical protein